MTDEQPPFYLSSGDYLSLEEPRDCYPVSRLRWRQRDDLLRIRVFPGIRSLDCEKNDDPDLFEVVIGTRHAGRTLFPINQWPLFISISQLLSEPDEDGKIPDEALKQLYWGELYRTKEDAWRKRII